MTIRTGRPERDHVLADVGAILRQVARLLEDLGESPTAPTEADVISLRAERLDRLRSGGA